MRWEANQFTESTLLDYARAQREEARKYAPELVNSRSATLNEQLHGELLMLLDQPRLSLVYRSHKSCGSFRFWAKARSVNRIARCAVRRLRGRGGISARFAGYLTNGAQRCEPTPQWLTVSPLRSKCRGSGLAVPRARRCRPTRRRTFVTDVVSTTGVADCEASSHDPNRRIYRRCTPEDRKI